MAFHFPWTYPVRIIQVILGLAVLALTAYVMTLFRTSETINFMLFNGIWTGFFATPYLSLAPVLFPRLAHRVIIPAVEGVTAAFWLAGFIAVAVLLPSPSECRWDRCSALQAITVLGAVEWAFFMATTINAVIAAVRSSRRIAKANNSSAPAPETSTNEASAHGAV